MARFVISTSFSRGREGKAFIRQMKITPLMIFVISFLLVTLGWCFVVTYGSGAGGVTFGAAFLTSLLGFIVFFMSPESGLIGGAYGIPGWQFAVGTVGGFIMYPARSSGERKQVKTYDKDSSAGNEGDDDTYTHTNEDSLGEMYRNTVMESDEEEEQGHDGVERNSKHTPSQKFKDRVETVRSDLDKVDALATNGDIAKARDVLDNLQSRLDLMENKASQQGFDDLLKEITTLQRKCGDRLTKESLLRRLQEMNEYKFEELVAKIWEKQGWNTQITSGSADRGVDIVVTRNDPFEQRQLIQAKRYGKDNKVDSGEMQKYASLHTRDEKVDAVVVVTSNEFTKEAEQVSNNRNVKTMNGERVVELLISISG